VPWPGAVTATTAAPSTICSGIGRRDYAWTSSSAARALSSSFAILSAMIDMKDLTFALASNRSTSRA
ncbi:MAG: hypothetical protein ACXWNB_04445, partial [Candidatus Binataceae bacterium]